MLREYPHREKERETEREGTTSANRAERGEMDIKGIKDRQTLSIFGSLGYRRRRDRDAHTTRHGFNDLDSFLASTGIGGVFVKLC